MAGCYQKTVGEIQLRWTVRTQTLDRAVSGLNQIVNLSITLTGHLETIQILGACSVRT